MIVLWATLIGLTLGLLGGGGSILAVPVLTYAAHLPAKAAIATSLVVVGTTALFALLPHARRRNVEWRTGAFFALTTMAGGYLGGRVAGLFSGSTLLVLFAVMMVLTALVMFEGRGDVEVRRHRPLPIGLVLLQGLAVGAATGLVGAGGGFLVVPALVLVGRMPMHKAVGTSLLVIALNSLAAFAGHAAHVSVDVPLVTRVASAAVAGSIAGAALSSRAPADALRRVFALLVLAMAAYILWREAGAPSTGLVMAMALLGFLALRQRRAGRLLAPGAH